MSRLGQVAALVISLLLVSPRGHAVTFTVGSTADFPDLDLGDGECRVNLTGDPICTLRAAIQQTNELSGPDEIVLPAGTYNLAIPGADENVSATGDLDVVDDLTVRGSGVGGTVVDGIDAPLERDRIFHIFDADGGSEGPVVVIRDLTLRDGEEIYGGGIAIYHAKVTLANVALVDNTASGGGGLFTGTTSSTVLTEVTVMSNVAVGGPELGGGIWNTGTMTIDSSSILANFSTGVGGGIANHAGSTLQMINSTIGLNSATGDGGGVHNEGSLEIVSSTFAGNHSGVVGDDLYHEVGSDVLLKNSILNSPQPASCGGSGTVVSDGYNVENGDSCDLNHPTDGVNFDPHLLPLGDYGGPTLVFAIPPTSTAVDSQNDDPSTCSDLDGALLTRDQRGRPRPLDGDGDGIFYCDSGSVEADWVIFVDRFESGDMSAWSAAVP